MTFREKLAQEHPENVDDDYTGGCYSCPSYYGYEGHDDGLCLGSGDDDEDMCRACWNREMPMTPEKQERHDLEINAEILHGYCGAHPVCDDCPANKACHNGEWDKPCYKLSTQLATLAAFKAALPPEEEAPTVRLTETVTVKIGPQEPVEDKPWHLTPELRQRAHDAVNHPAHYTAGGIECIDAITAALECHGNPVAAFLTGQVLKYMWRWPMKGGREDLRKARWYLDRLLDEGDLDA